jgi:hypothetical protein
MRTRLTALLLVVLSWSTGWSSSVFSVWGLGQVVDGTNSRVTALGGLGLALPSEGRPSFRNPASHATIPVACFGLTFAPEVTWIEDPHEHNRLVSTTLPTVELALPLGLGASGWLGLRQETDLGFAAVREDSLEGELFTRELSREGGLHSIVAGAAWGDTGWLSVGAEARFLFGGIVERRVLDFQNNLYDDTDDEQTSTFRGTTWRLGALIRPHSRISVGGVLSTPRDLRVTYETVNSIGVERRWGGQLRYPASLGMGVAVAPWGPVVLSADWWETRWGATRWEETGQTFENTTAVGFGIEVKASRTEGRRFLRQFPLRFGYSRVPWYTWEEGTSRPTDTRLTMGTSVPLLGRRGFVDITLEYGEQEASGIREKSFGIQIGAVGFERWALDYE